MIWQALASLTPLRAHSSLYDARAIPASPPTSDRSRKARLSTVLSGEARYAEVWRSAPGCSTSPVRRSSASREACRPPASPGASPCTPASALPSRSLPVAADPRDDLRTGSLIPYGHPVHRRASFRPCCVKSKGYRAAYVASDETVTERWWSGRRSAVVHKASRAASSRALSRTGLRDRYLRARTSRSSSDRTSRSSSR